MLTVYQNLITMMIQLTNWALSPLKIITTDKVKIFKQGMVDVKAKATKVDQLKSMLNITGTAGDKENLKNMLCDILISITYPVKSYALVTKNDILLQQVKMSRSTYSDMSAPKLVSTTRALHTLILPLLPKLTTAGVAVTSTDMDLLNIACNSFNDIVTAPKEGIQNRKSINRTIAKLVREANQICHDILDNNIVSYKALDPLYVQDYYIKREVTPTGVHHTNFETVCTLFQDQGQKLYDVLITINGTTRLGITDIDGFSKVQRIPPGNHTVTATYKQQSITSPVMHFAPGKTVTFNFSFDQSLLVPDVAPVKNNQNA